MRASLTVGLWAAVVTQLQLAYAAIYVAEWTNCLKDYSPIAAENEQLKAEHIYAELVPSKDTASRNLSDDHDTLRLDVIGTLGSKMSGYNESNNRVATLFVETYEAGVKQWTTASWVCASLWPAKLSEPYPPQDAPNYCPIDAGPFGLNVTVPLYNVHALTTLSTRIRIVDTRDYPQTQTIGCYNVRVTPYEAESWPYRLFLWFPAALAIGFFVVTWAARFAAGWVIGVDRAGTGRRETAMIKWATMLISGLSGERFSVSAALIRFVTPGLRDIIYHIQFVTMLGMLAVHWPKFFYPIVGKSAWADLVWNTTLVANSFQNVQPPNNFTADPRLAYQINDPQYPLYLNNSAPNHVLDLKGTRDGMESFARVVGLYPEDLFGTCLSLFLILGAGIIVVHLLLWLAHLLTEFSGKSNKADQAARALYRQSLQSTAATSASSKEWLDGRRSQSTDYANLALPEAYNTQGPPQSRAIPLKKLSAPSKFHRIRTRFSLRGEAGAFHFAALYGNLLRLLFSFHFPITAFSIYQLTLTHASKVSRAFAGLAFAFVSVLLPAAIMFKISRTPTRKLYDAARTLMSLGTVYNEYEQEKQMYRVLPLLASLVSGIAIGAGQNSGLAQAIVIMVVELCTFLATTFWSPWAQGASMGAPITFISIARIASVVLAIVCSHAVHLDEVSREWLAYIVLLIQAIVFVFFALMLITKITEGLIRLFGRAPFDESKHPIDGGIFAAIMDLDMFNGDRGGKAAERRRRKQDSQALKQNVNMAGTLTTQMILDRHSRGVDREGYPILSPTSEPDHRGAYLPVPGPGASSVSVNSSDESRVMESRIMDAWKPQTSYETGGHYNDVVPPASPPEERREMLMSPRQAERQMRSASPPDIFVTGSSISSREDWRGHGRTQSSPQILEGGSSSQASSPGHPTFRSLSTSPRPLDSYPPTLDAQGVAYPRLNERNRPPPLNLPRRNSLNEIPAETAERRGKKRRSWFGRSGREATEDSDDDDDVLDDDDWSESHQEPARSWRNIFRKRRTLDDRERDEKSARKAAQVNKNAAQLAGIATPASSTSTSTAATGTGFRVHHKRPSQQQRSSAEPLLLSARPEKDESRSRPESQTTEPPTPMSLNTPMVPGDNGFRVVRPRQTPQVSEPIAAHHGEISYNPSGYTPNMFVPLKDDD